MPSLNPCPKIRKILSTRASVDIVRTVACLQSAKRTNYQCCDPHYWFEARRLRSSFLEDELDSRQFRGNYAITSFDHLEPIFGSPWTYSDCGFESLHHRLPVNASADQSKLKVFLKVSRSTAAIRSMRARRRAAKLSRVEACYVTLEFCSPR